MNYTLLQASAPLERNHNAPLIIAGDGVYQPIYCAGASIPNLVAPCEIRGLLPLMPLLCLEGAETEVAPGGGEFDFHTLPFAPTYHLMTGTERPVLDTARIYQYVIASNGVFLLAGCSGIEVFMPISAPCTIPSLPPAAPSITWKYPRVDEEVVNDLFARARAAKQEDGSHMLERLFYLTFEQQWHVHEPEQDPTASHVRALSSSEADETAPIEGHSHHDMIAFFSSTDNRDEIINGGFKVYFVLGSIHEHPQIRVRVCVHGYSWEVSARLFFALPEQVQDCFEERVR